MVNFGSINTETQTQQQEFTTEYKKLLTWTDDGLVSQFILLNCLDGTITINKTGNYQVIFSVSFKATNERNYDLAVFKDGVLQPQVKTQRFFGPNLKTGDVYGSGFIEVTSIPTVIDLRAKCDVSDANVMVVENAVLSCIEILPDSVTDDISCKVTKSADQTIPDDTNTVITWDQEDYDTDGMHDNVTNNSRITIKTAGKYSVMAQAVWAFNSTNRRVLDIIKNSIVIGRMNYSAGSNSQSIVSVVDEFAVNDILELSVNQDSGGNLNFVASGIPYFEAHKIS